MLLAVAVIAFLLGFAFGRVWEIFDNAIILAHPIDEGAVQGRSLDILDGPVGPTP
jgi:hypothetical protein